VRLKSELARAIRRRDVSCCEMMEAYLDHIDRLNPIANAITLRLSRGGLIARARHRDAQLRRGEYLGWMHGLPMAIKEYRGKARYGLVAARMKNAGCIILGEANDPLSMPECGPNNNPVRMPLNAYDQPKTAGGGAAGAAVAVALRMLPVAAGHEVGGSVHNPAAFNNVLGFRPSAARTPPEAHDLLTSAFAARFLMARSVRDLARLFFVQSEYDHLKSFTTIEDRAPCAKPLEGASLRTRASPGLAIWMGNSRLIRASQTSAIRLSAFWSLSVAEWNGFAVSIRSNAFGGRGVCCEECRHRPCSNVTQRSAVARDRRSFRGGTASAIVGGARTTFLTRSSPAVRGAMLSRRCLTVTNSLSSPPRKCFHSMRDWNGRRELLVRR
jgi:hypothetical protein